MTQPDSNEINRDDSAVEFSLAGAEFQRGQVVGGRYRVLSLLGKGGMGIVYRVEQIFLGKELALKTIDKALMSDITIRRFQAEARAAFAVDHPNIISVNDFGLLDDQTPFLVMEIVQGETLGAILKNRTLSVEEAIPFFIQVCFGLAHAHENGVVHRDIKPNNLMVLTQMPFGTEGSVKILDFGIAKLTQHEGGEIQALTKTGEIFGSPLYMSPEQCSGGKVDHRSDIYSLGCVLFEALTGTTPFFGESALSTMMMHQSGSVPSLKEASLGKDFPAELDRVIQAMLAKQPDNRYQNLGKAAHDLAAIKRGETLHLNANSNPKPTVQPDPTVKIISMRRDHFYSLLLAVVLIPALTTALLMHLFQASQKRERFVKSEITEIKSAPVSYDSIEFSDGIKKRACRFQSNDLATDESMNAFKNYKEVQAVELADCTVTDNGIANLKNSKTLRLKLRNCNITSVDNIAQLEYLQDLDLRQTKINDSAIAQLVRLKMLTTLNLQGCEQLTEKGLLQLTQSTSLMCVYLTKSKYSNGLIEELQRKMPQCMFPEYSDSARIQQEEHNFKTQDEYLRFSHLRSIAEQANPRGYSVATYSLMMGNVRMAQGRMLEAGKLLQDATELLELNGHLKYLAIALSSESNFAASTGDMKKAVALQTRAAPLYMDTQYHDEPPILKQLEELTVYPMQIKDFSKTIAYCQQGIDLIEQFPTQDRNYLPVFYERAGWCYYLQNDLKKALDYFQKNLVLVRANKNRDPNSYARQLIEIGHCLPEPNSRKALYDEAIGLLDTLGLPEEKDLKEHYCSACTNMAAIYDQESKPDESIRYLRKALTAVMQMKHPDTSKLKITCGKALVQHLKAAGRTEEARQEALKYGVVE